MTAKDVDAVRESWKKAVMRHRYGWLLFVLHCRQQDQRNAELNSNREYSRGKSRVCYAAAREIFAGLNTEGCNTQTHDRELGRGATACFTLGPCNSKAQV